MSESWRLPNRRATIDFGRLLAATMQPGDLLLLDGDLGAGKTFLVRAMLRALGLPHETAVRSPTFVLVEEYDDPLVYPVVHADLYRLGGDTEQVAGLGLAERRREGAAVIVEWGVPFWQPLGGDGLAVRLRVEGSQDAHVPRSVALEPHGPRGQAWAAQLAGLRAQG
jgi:tRNA threonylcarbamoyladenosine biosynthesis protein TsaE